MFFIAKKHNEFRIYIYSYSNNSQKNILINISHEMIIQLRCFNSWIEVQIPLKTIYFSYGTVMMIVYILQIKRDHHASKSDTMD